MRLRLCVLAIALVGCSELPPITEHQCGNGIIEPFEDCDSPSATCVQCRFTCDGSTCPDGYSCGTDQVCHAPGAAFADPVTSVPFPVLGYRISDVDRDGFGDVVGINESTLVTRYGDPDASLSYSSRVITPTLQGSPSLTHLEDPDVDDLVMPVGDGLVAYTSAFDVPSPRQFPVNGAGSFGGRPDPIDVISVGTSIGVIGTLTGDATLRFAVFAVGTSFGYDADADTLCGSSYSANDYVKDSLVSYRSGSTTFVALRPSASTVCTLAVTELSPGLFAIASMTSFSSMSRYTWMDLDGDGCPSLLDTSNPSFVTEYAGTSQNAECTLPASPTATWGTPSSVVTALPLDPPRAGSAPDALVTSTGIYAVDPTTHGLTEMYTHDRPILAATSADLDGDARADVVLTTGFASVDIALRNSDDDHFLVRRTSTAGSVVTTIVGDFDGDARNDLGYIERLGNRQQLSIAYGKPGGLDDGVPVDAFNNVLFLSVVSLRDSGDPFSLVDDLIAADLDANSTRPEITLLHGSANRTMLSFYGPAQPTGLPFRAVVAGHYDESGESAGRIDLLGFESASGGKYAAIYRIPGLPDGRLGAATVLAENPAVDFGSCDGEPRPYFCLDFAAFASASRTDGTTIALGVDVRPDGSPSKLLRVDPSGSITVSVTDGVFPAAGPVRNVEKVDVDLDGAPEILFAFGPGANGARGFVWICELTADAQLGACVDVATQIVDDPAAECVSFTHGDLTLPCERTAAVPDDLVVLCRDAERSHLLQIAQTDGVYRVERELVSVTGTALDDAQLGDVTGDGLDDLVVRTVAGELSVYPQLPSRDSNRCFPAD